MRLQRVRMFSLWVPRDRPLTQLRKKPKEQVCISSTIDGWVVCLQTSILLRVVLTG